MFVVAVDQMLFVAAAVQHLMELLKIVLDCAVVEFVPVM